MEFDFSNLAFVFSLYVLVSLATKNTKVILVSALDQCTGSRSGFGPQTLNPACQCTSGVGVGAFNCDK